MTSRNTIQQELQELNSGLPYNIEKPVFSVPPGYFENFAAAMLAKVRQQSAATVSVQEELNELSPLLAGISKKMPFSLPEDYFEKLSNDVPAFAATDELPEILAGHHRQLPYEVPAGYFENLPTQVLAKAAPKHAKVISFGSRGWRRMAAAAVVTGLIGLSSILYFNNKETIDPSAQPQAWVEKKLKGVSNADLEAFIETADVNAADANQSGSETAEARTLLNDVSSKEMDAFLAAMPTDDDELLLIN